MEGFWALMAPCSEHGVSLLESYVSVTSWLPSSSSDGEM